MRGSEEDSVPGGGGSGAGWRDDGWGGGEGWREIKRRRLVGVVARVVRTHTAARSGRGRVEKSSAEDRIGSEAEGLLRGVDHVEEAVVVALLLVHLADGRRHAHHAALVHQQKERLVGVQLQTAPYNLDKLAHVDMVRHQKLGFVQHWQLLLSAVSLNDNRDFVGVLRADQLHVLHPLGETPPLLEGLLRRHRSLGASSRLLLVPFCLR